MHACLFFSLSVTGQVFSKDNKNESSSLHTKKIEELKASKRVPCWRSFLTVSSWLVQTLWMSEMTPSKTPVLKPLVLHFFFCEGLSSHFLYHLRKPHLCLKKFFSQKCKSSFYHGMNIIKLPQGLNSL